MQTKILLVDDREDNLLSMESILAPDGYVLVKAKSGREALKILLTQFDFALILMDVKMPSMNGFETAALIYEREKLKHIPIIFITAHTYGEENIFKGYRMGAVDYIYKPINPELLRMKVAVFVDLYAKTHKLLAQEQKLRSINTSLENEISERKASEDRVKVLNKQLLDNIARLESANKDLDRFAFMASHDLQEPLRKIRTFSDLLLVKKADILDDFAQTQLKRIQNAVERMQRLINDILTFSKISGEDENFEYYSLESSVREVLQDLDHVVQNKKADVVVENLPSLPVNPGLMRPLFLNLIGNALKYSNKTSTPVITIRSELSNSESLQGNTPNKYCRIYVEDNGLGFDQKYAEQIFDMFRRVHTGAEYEGTGIGLAICKKIVEKHNGFISAQSKINQGSVFIISLPVSQPSVLVEV